MNSNGKPSTFLKTSVGLLILLSFINNVYGNEKVPNEKLDISDPNSRILLLSQNSDSFSIDAEEEFWRVIRESNDYRDYEDYLEQFPKGRFREIALLKLRNLRTSPFILQISQKNAERFGKKIWEKECRLDIICLTDWNKGEDFASIGIGHFIWYPKNTHHRFTETFPNLLRFLKKQNIDIPQWLNELEDFQNPWNNREAFIDDLNGDKLLILRQFMLQTIPYQARFIANRIEEALPAIKNHLPAFEQRHVKTQLTRLAQTMEGLYAIVDYINFKGEGISQSERYNGQGWGITQVLLEMKGEKPGREAIEEFAQKAAIVLRRRVANAPKHKKEHRWLKGWMVRINSYLDAW